MNYMVRYKVVSAMGEQKQGEWECGDKGRL